MACRARALEHATVLSGTVARPFQGLPSTLGAGIVSPEAASASTTRNTVGPLLPRPPYPSTSSPEHVHGRGPWCTAASPILSYPELSLASVGSPSLPCTSQTSSFSPSCPPAPSMAGVPPPASTPIRARAGFSPPPLLTRKASRVRRPFSPHLPDRRGTVPLPIIAWVSARLGQSPPRLGHPPCHPRGAPDAPLPGDPSGGLCRRGKALAGAQTGLDPLLSRAREEEEDPAGGPRRSVTPPAGHVI